MKLIISRRKAREKAVQVLYSWQVSHNDLLDIQSHFMMEYDMTGVNVSYFNALCLGVVGYSKKIDNLIKPYLLCDFSKLGYIELTVLRIAVFEFIEYIDIPYKVVINEAIELSKIFGSENSYKFVNGVLDKMAVKIRCF